MEITIYFHNRPEGTQFDNVRDAARYLYPDDDAGFENACDELESFHETAHRERFLMACRTDENAYQPTD